MSLASINGDVRDIMNSSECLRPIQEPMNGAPPFQNTKLLNGAKKEFARTKESLQSVEQQNVEMRWELKHMESEMDSLKSYNTNLEKRAAQTASENEVLKAKVESLTTALKENFIELCASKVHNTDLEKKIARTVSENEGFRARVNLLKASNTDLRTKDAQKTSEIEILKAKVDSLTTASSEKDIELQSIKASAAKTCHMEREASREAVQEASNIRIQMRALQTELETAKKDRDWHRKEHTDILDARNKHNATCHSNIHRLKSENGQLKKKNKDLTEKLSNQLHHIAAYITDLDLVLEGVRIYKCEHDDYGNIPYKVQHTQLKKGWMVANDMYNQWEDEEEFLEGYADARQDFLDHHRGHERLGHRKGDNSVQIQVVLNEVDRKRGAVINYS